MALPASGTVHLVMTAPLDATYGGVNAWPSVAESFGALHQDQNNARLVNANMTTRLIDKVSTDSWALSRMERSLNEGVGIPKQSIITNVIFDGFYIIAVAAGFTSEIAVMDYDGKWDAPTASAAWYTHPNLDLRFAVSGTVSGVDGFIHAFSGFVPSDFTEDYAVQRWRNSVEGVGQGFRVRTSGILQGIRTVLLKPDAHVGDLGDIHGRLYQTTADFNPLDEVVLATSDPIPYSSLETSSTFVAPGDETDVNFFGDPVLLSGTHEEPFYYAIVFSPTESGNETDHLIVKPNQTDPWTTGPHAAGNLLNRMVVTGTAVGWNEVNYIAQGHGAGIGECQAGVPTPQFAGVDENVNPNSPPFGFFQEVEFPEIFSVNTGGRIEGFEEVIQQFIAHPDYDPGKPIAIALGGGTMRDTAKTQALHNVFPGRTPPTMEISWRRRRIQNI